MTSATRDITILIPDDLHEHAVARIESEFRAVHMDRADVAQVTPELARSVRGIGCLTLIEPAFIDALPNLEIIANFGVGYDLVDSAHCGKVGVMVTNTPDILTEEVADTALGLLINTVRELPRAEQWVREGRWAGEGPYRFTPGTLRGRHAGIFGMGRIGQAIARRLEAFGLKVSYHNRRKADGVAYDYHPTLKGLAGAVDTLICVAPGGPSTEKAIDAEILAALGPDGVFVNIGRGSSVDEEALIAALESRAILAAGLDVFADEPHVPQRLLDLPNVSVLPHVGSASQHTRRAMADMLVDNLVSWFQGKGPLNPVPETEGVTARRGTAS